MKLNKTKLAIYGGTPLYKNHNELITKWPIVKNKDILDMVELLKKKDFSGRNSGTIRELEDALCKYLDVKFCSLFSSGTAALHGCINALNISVGDEVIVPAYAFLAPAMAVLHNGAIPIFCDIEPRTFNIDPAQIEKLITKRTKAVIAVSMHGLPADLIKLKKICKKNKISLIEDCAQAFGAKIGDKYCGSFGSISAYSFMSAKQLATCGELGAVVTNSVSYINKANILKTYGEVVGGNGERSYNSYSLGYNYVPNTLQAKFALNKLETVSDIEIIIKNAQILSDYLKKNIPFLIPPYVPKSRKHVYHFFRVIVDGSKIGFRHNGVLRQAIMEIMEKEGLKLRLYQNTPICGQYIFQSLNKISGGFPFSINPCSDRHYRNNYNIEKYTNTLKTIEESFIVGGLGAAPLYFQSSKAVRAYIKGFDKIMRNIGDVILYAHSIEKRYKRPWEDINKISDTNNEFKLCIK